jgi:hypothetical protein
MLNTVRNPLLAKEFEKLAQSWLRLTKAAERGDLVLFSSFPGPREGSYDKSTAPPEDVSKAKP